MHTHFLLHMIYHMHATLPDKLKTLIQILSDGQFHSGEALGKNLGITRVPVWKLIQQLNKLDLQLGN